MVSAKILPGKNTYIYRNTPDPSRPLDTFQKILKSLQGLELSSTRSKETSTEKYLLDDVLSLAYATS